ncbi:MAG: AAA family ATPase, partial [Spirochaetia bacterium]|nr:AAA family ATPase [Spirochaetia bacterium]
QSIYGFYDNSKFGKPNYNGSLNVDYLNEIITGNVNKEKPKPYILIIDEINRGNVSKIFGELITLLEADKRTDGSHPISVTLPYSKKKFLVPSNLYIIGTMNTTDRSVGSIDYAVRRRFSFVTLNSDKEIVERESKAGKAVYLFDSVRNFIAKNKIDMDIEDLMVGHSYFLAEDDNALQMKWEYDIVPLLREYYKDGIIKSDIEKNISIEKFIGQNSASFQKADNE